MSITPLSPAAREELRRWTLAATHGAGAVQVRPAVQQSLFTPAEAAPVAPGQAELFGRKARE